ncbi:MAG: Outer membrane porin F precursor [Bacteroidetes bacterium ADurb.Bin141]|nr:MAG: Outer membrane porin F precursor [Bacteroidetes bacterium ADurb.Bin141]
MTIRIMKPILLIIALIASSVAFAQQDDLVLANQLYSKYSFGKAIPLYEKVLSKKYNHETAARLADCYRRNNQYKEAEKWYERVTADSIATSQEHLLYSGVLTSLGKKDKAAAQMKKYLDKKPDDVEVKAQLDALNSNNISSGKDLWIVKRLTINSLNGDMCATPYKDGIVFASSREGGKSKHQDWTSKPYLSLWFSQGKEDKLSTPVQLELGDKSKFNDGPVAFSADGNEMYITRNYEENGKIVRDKDRIVRLKIEIAKFVDGKFSDFKDFKYNNKTYSCAHPCLSTDGNKLYFSSDMPGGKGGMDLWVSNKVNGEWDKPVNLGSAINTSGNELFPYIDHEGNLYFASNGRVGLGGLDIYKSHVENGVFSDPENIGAPLNTTYDDFSYVYDKKNRCGYLTSNRDSKNENDDLYMFRKNCVPLDGLVYDKETNLPIANATVKISEAGNSFADVTTDDKGKFTACLSIGQNYSFMASKEGYQNGSGEIKDVSDEPQSIKIPLSQVPVFALEGHVYLEEDKSALPNHPVKLINLRTNEEKETLTDGAGNYHFDLEPETNYKVMSFKENCADNFADRSTVGLKKSTVLKADFGFFCQGDVIRIDNIYYDLAKWNIRPDAAKELDKLVEIMKKYPKMEIELGSHTDCRASYKYNMDLSQKRAKSAVEYLVKKGIEASRMIYKGYGESQLINHCECEGTRVVPCTEAEHQQNRRTEFKVLKVK